MARHGFGGVLLTERWGLVCNNAQAVGTWVCARSGEEWRPALSAAIGFTFDGKLAAGCVFYDYNGASIYVSFAVEDRRVINRASLWAAFSYPFEQLGCKRVTAVVGCDNVRAITFVKHLGFVHEATMIHATQTGDAHLYRLFRSECRWLRGHRYKPKK
jgi:RimJ/RimL family protein N-acetyltransferase